VELSTQRMSQIMIRVLRLNTGGLHNRLGRISRCCDRSQVRDMTISFEGSSQAQYAVEECDDGSIKVHYVPAVAGDAVIHIVCSALRNLLLRLHVSPRVVASGSKHRP
jgi:hypothetical protein